MLGAGGTITYLTIPGLLTGDLIFIAKFFLVLLAFITLGVVIFLIVKFRILISTSDKIISFYPFRLKLTVIKKEEIKSLKWYNWEQKGTLHKSLKIKASKEDEVEFSDFEFENFSHLESVIAEDCEQNEQRWKVLKEQAENNFGLAAFSSVIYFGLSICIIGFVILKQEFHWMPLSFIMAGIIFSFIETKKAIKYRKIKSTVYNQS